MKRFLSFLISISMLAGIVSTAWAENTDISEYVLNSFDYIDATTAAKPEQWTSGSHTLSYSNDVATISGTGNTSNSNGVFFGMKKNGNYDDALLDVLNEQLSITGSNIIFIRKKYLYPS